MKNRIDRFILVAGERLSNLNNPNFAVWLKLYKDLLETVVGEDEEYLKSQWGELQRKLKTIKWDENFLKAIDDEQQCAKEIMMSAYGKANVVIGNGVGSTTGISSWVDPQQAFLAQQAAQQLNAQQLNNARNAYQNSLTTNVGIAKAVSLP